MGDYSPEIYRDVLVFKALGYSYDDIATKVNERTGADLSGYAVGKILNDIEAEAKAASNPEQVVMHYIVRAYGAEIGGGLAANL